ncbi:MAG: hypothetical protein ACLPXT_00410 [Terracidiphilus sp.]
MQKDRIEAKKRMIAGAKASYALDFKLQLGGLGSVSEIKENIEAVGVGIAMGYFTKSEGSQLIHGLQYLIQVYEGRESFVTLKETKCKKSVQQPKSA